MHCSLWKSQHLQLLVNEQCINNSRITLKCMKKKKKKKGTKREDYKCRRSKSPIQMGTKSIPLCSPKLTILGEKNSARHTMQRARNFLVERERERERERECVRCASGIHTQLVRLGSYIEQEMQVCRGRRRDFYLLCRRLCVGFLDVERVKQKANRSRGLVCGFHVLSSSHNMYFSL